MLKELFQSRETGFPIESREGMPAIFDTRNDPIITVCMLK